MTDNDDQFDETVLRAAIVSIWGEHGAHIDVFDVLMARIAELEDTDAITSREEYLQVAAEYTALKDEYAKVERMDQALPNLYHHLQHRMWLWLDKHPEDGFTDGPWLGDVTND